MSTRAVTTLEDEETFGPLGELVGKVKDPADWESPMNRRAQVLKPGMDQQIISRFEAERKALAVMVPYNNAKMLKAAPP